MKKSKILISIVAALTVAVLGTALVGCDKGAQQIGVTEYMAEHNRAITSSAQTAQDLADTVWTYRYTRNAGYNVSRTYYEKAGDTNTVTKSIPVTTSYDFTETVATGHVGEVTVLSYKASGTVAAQDHEVDDDGLLVDLSGKTILQMESYLGVTTKDGADVYYATVTVKYTQQGIDNGSSESTHYAVFDGIEEYNAAVDEVLRNTVLNTYFNALTILSSPSIFEMMFQNGSASQDNFYGRYIEEIVDGDALLPTFAADRVNCTKRGASYTLETELAKRSEGEFTMTANTTSSVTVGGGQIKEVRSRVHDTVEGEVGYYSTTERKATLASASVVKLPKDPFSGALSDDANGWFSYKNVLTV